MSDDLLMTPDAAADAFESRLSGEDQEETAATTSPQEEGAPQAVEEAAEDPEEVAEEEESEEEEPEEEAKYKILVNGQEEHVTLDELVNGFQRQRDYTQKTQALSEERKQNQALLNEYTNRINQVQQIADQLQAQANTPDPADNIDWNKLYQEDPVEWTVQRQLYQDRQQLRAQQDQQLQYVKQEQQRLQAEQFAGHLQEQRQRLLELVPEWKDAEVAKSEKAAMRAFAIEHYGMSETDVNQAYDARLVKLLRDAYLFHNGQAKAAEAVKPTAEKPSTTKGRTYRPDNPNTRLRKAEAQLRKTGTLEDAESVFAERFG